jgi:hypothetical protein
MSLIFNLEQSLELCPPEKRVIHEDFKDEIEFVGRIILDNSKVSFRLQDQTRSLGVVPSDVSDIKVSLKTHGYLHTEYPPIIFPDTDKPGYYDGLSGFNRNAACEELGEKEFIYDVYKFKTPLAKFILSKTSNHIFNPKSPNTKEDLILQTLKAIEEGLIENDDNRLKYLIDIIAADKSVKERENILKGVRTFKTKFSHLRTYHCSRKGGQRSTKEAALKFNLGWEGDKNLANSGKLGYIPPYGNPVTAFEASEKLLKKYGFRDIEFTFFIPEPLPEPQLTIQRQEKLNQFNNAKLKKAEFYQVLLSEFGVIKSIDEIMEKLPYKANGFLPQHENPDPSKGGRPTEDTIVDVNGNPLFVEKQANVLKFGT